MRITTNNGTTISGSLSEVLATLSHLGVKAEATKPVTSAEVTETTVTDAGETTGDGYVVSLAPKGSYLPISYDEMAGQLAKLHAGGTVTPEVVATPVPVPKPARDSVIKMAIADVESLLSENYSSGGVVDFVGETLWFASKGGFSVTDEVLFTINANKRTVTAVIRHNRGQHKVLSKGRAKCAHGDVFNEHIGKAIALRRALGLEVPVEYYEVEARDSDDLAVGDVVRGNIDKEYYDILKFIDRPPLEVYTGKIIRTKQYPHAGYLRGDEVTLINDSARHTAPDLEVSRIIRH